MTSSHNNNRKHAQCSESLTWDGFDNYFNYIILTRKRHDLYLHENTEIWQRFFIKQKHLEDIHRA